VIAAALAAEFEKIARLYARSPMDGGEWSDAFKGTPFYAEALAVAKLDAAEEVEKAKLRVVLDSLREEIRKIRDARDEVIRPLEKKEDEISKQMWREDSPVRMKATELEARLAEWKFKNMDTVEKVAKVLTAKGRKQVAEKNFALPGGRYPIHDASHARNALARVSQYGTPAEKAAVRARVAAKYPGIGGGEKTASVRKLLALPLELRNLLLGRQAQTKEK